MKTLWLRPIANLSLRMTSVDLPIPGHVIYQIIMFFWVFENLLHFLCQGLFIIPIEPDDDSFVIGVGSQWVLDDLDNITDVYFTENLEYLFLCDLLAHFRNT